MPEDYTNFSFVLDVSSCAIGIFLDIIAWHDIREIKTSEADEIKRSWYNTVLYSWNMYVFKILTACGVLFLWKKRNENMQRLLRYSGAFITFSQTVFFLRHPCSFYVPLLYSVKSKLRFVWVTLRSILQGHQVFSEMQSWYRQSLCRRISYSIVGSFCSYSLVLPIVCSRERRDKVFLDLQTPWTFLAPCIWILMIGTYFSNVFLLIMAFKPSLSLNCSAAVQIQANESYLVWNGTVDSGELFNLTGPDTLYHQIINGADLLANNFVTASTNCTNVVSRDAEPFYALHSAEHDTSKCNFTISIALNTKTLIPHYNFGILMVANGFEHCLETKMDNPTVPFPWQSDYFHLVNDSFGPNCDKCNNTNMTQLLNENIVPFLADHSNNVPFFACSSSLECTAGWTNISAVNLWDILLVKVTFGGSQADAVYDNNLPTCLRDSHASDVGAYGLYIPWNIYYWVGTFFGMGLVSLSFGVYKMVFELETNFERKTCEFFCYANFPLLFFWRKKGISSTRLCEEFPILVLTETTSEDSETTRESRVVLLHSVQFATSTACRDSSPYHQCEEAQETARLLIL